MKYVLVLVLGMLCSFSHAQCRKYTKQDCIPALGDYKHNGKMNFASLFLGSKANMDLLVNADQKYRIVFCFEKEILGNVQFIVRNRKKQELFNSREANSAIFDFTADRTQKLFIEIQAPESSRPNYDEGCISVVVGVDLSDLDD